MQKEMTVTKAAASVAVLHPGKMGISVANALMSTGNHVYWVSEARSEATTERACELGLTDAKSLQQACKSADVIFSICPPEAALSLAEQVAGQNYIGTYVDCNAISPSTALQMADIVTAGGGRFTDAGIVGLPPERPGTTRLYLAGKQATSVARLFKGSLLDTVVFGDEPGAASALKMAYAAWTKGSAALLMNVFALARREGVADALLDEWAASLPDLEKRLHSSVSANAQKAWRFTGEMREIGRAFSDADLPREWFSAAEQTYQQLSGFKNNPSTEFDEAIDALFKQ